MLLRQRYKQCKIKAAIASGETIVKEPPSYLLKPRKETDADEELEFLNSLEQAIQSEELSDDSHFSSSEPKKSHNLQ